MLFAEDAQGGCHVLPEEGLRVDEIAAPQQEQPQLVLARRGFAMLVAEQLLPESPAPRGSAARPRPAGRDPGARAPARRASRRRPCLRVRAAGAASRGSRRSSGSAAASRPRRDGARRDRSGSARCARAPGRATRRPIASACSSSGSALASQPHPLVGPADHVNISACSSGWSAELALRPARRRCRAGSGRSAPWRPGSG